MTTGELILVALGMSFPVCLVLWARWSQQRLERDDPARQDGPAE